MTGQRTVGRLDVFGNEVSANDHNSLQIITAGAQVLPVDHIVTGLVFSIHGRRVERIEDIHRRIEHAVAPGYCLASDPDHHLVTRITGRQSIQALNERGLAFVTDDIRQIE